MDLDTSVVLRFASNFVQSFLDRVRVQNRSHFEIASLVMEGEPPKSPDFHVFRLFDAFSDLNVHINARIHVYNEFFVVGVVLRCAYTKYASLKLRSHCVLAFLLRI